MRKKTVSALTRKRRLMFLFIIFSAISLLLMGRLIFLQAIKGDYYYNQAWEQWNRGIPTYSPRGNIYDCNGNLLAGNELVNDIVARPSQIEDIKTTAAVLAPLLELDEKELYEKMTTKSDSIYLSRRKNQDIGKQILKLNLEGIYVLPNYNRYYPNGCLASQLLGIAGLEQGWSGLEFFYEEQLKGETGRIYFMTDAQGKEIPGELDYYVPPTEGNKLILTIDETIQFIMEKELSRAMLETQAEHAMAIAVNPQTGEVIAAASRPHFDPADYADYPTENRNLLPVTMTFEPGSTFKLTTLAASIEEGIYNEAQPFTCSGVTNVEGAMIHCWKTHGTINFLKAVLSSCNSAFINLGQRVGEKQLLHYIDALGYGKQSGIDYPGEGTGIIFNEETMGPVELATTSFGQGVSVTPLQQVMAVSAIANGGKLLQPYIVSEIRDSRGNLIEKFMPKVRNTPITPETAKRILGIMEQVVVEGSGMNAYIEGYRIAGKTGTAQKVGSDGRYLSGNYILSFVGIFPVEDPRIVMYIAVDGAKSGALWGSQISAPVFRRIMEEIIHYLGIEPVTTAEENEQEQKNMVIVPDLSGLTYNNAAAKVDTMGLLLKPVGKGEIIQEQTPAAGTKVPLQTQVIIYLGEESPVTAAAVEIPRLAGMNENEAAQLINWLGLKMNGSGSGVAVKQDIAPGSIVNKGIQINVTFSDELE